MLKKDKIKIGIVVTLLSLLGISLFVFGKESAITKYTSGFCLLAWLTTMIIVNKKY